MGEVQPAGPMQHALRGNQRGAMLQNSLCGKVPGTRGVDTERIRLRRVGILKVEYNGIILHSLLKSTWFDIFLMLKVPDYVSI